MERNSLSKWGLALLGALLSAQLAFAGGHPILLVGTSSNQFSFYYSEILHAEGLNDFDSSDISTLTASTLSTYDLVILGQVALTPAQVTMFSTWVNGGGNLIAMRPDKQLASLLGINDAGTTLTNGYLSVNTSAAPGAGIVGQPIQFHGTADLYSPAGASVVAAIYSNASTATSYPAVTLRTGIGSGGSAATFTYDLARSIVYTRQGNPAWAGQARVGQGGPIRAVDMFYGAASFDPQPDWEDLNNVAIPQADEQQRLLANLILYMNRAKTPLPRFWYFPGAAKAVVVMTGDDHGSYYSGSATNQRFGDFLAASPAGCSVSDWQCVRATAYLFPQAIASNPLTDSQVAAYSAQGFEIALHADSSPTCSDWTAAGLDTAFTDLSANLAAQFPSIPPLRTHRMHCISWSDFDSEPKVELNHGIRFDTTYYYWPASWVNDRPGMFTGSGMPMKFADANGNLIDVYQAATQMTDESGQTYPAHIDTLLDNALGAPGYYGAFVVNAHNDLGDYPGIAPSIVASAQSRGVPVVSALQMLTWLDGRNGSSFGSISWNANTLTFAVSAAAGANGLQAMLPAVVPAGRLSSLTQNGSAVAYSFQTVKGIQYAVFQATSGTYQAGYSATWPPVITAVTASAGTTTATITWNTDESSSSQVDYGTTTSLGSTVFAPGLTTLHSVSLSGLAATTTYYFRVTSAVDAINSSSSPATPATASFTTIDMNPPVITALTVTPAIGGTATITWTTNKLSDSRVDYGTSTSLGSAVSNPGMVTAHSVALAGLTTGATYYYRVTSADAVSNSASSPAPPGVASFAENAPLSLWNSSATPAEVDSNDGGSVELGLKFRSDVAGSVTGIRFYKAPHNTGTHIGNLWNATGTLLGTVTFSNETASGWQEADFATPVPIAAGTTYIVSYFAPVGHYSDNTSGFASAGADNPPLHALADGVDGPNGVYLYASASGFPNLTYSSTNYWVDLAFLPSDSIPPVIAGFTVPASSASLTVPVANFNATDNVGVVGYLVTESSAPPAANASGWSATPPASYTCATAGNKTLYAWAKDAAGNVSASVSGSVVITLTDTIPPVITAFTIPATATSPTVPITSLFATDNVGVAGYLVNESASSPSPGDPRWSAGPPASYAFASGGAKILYAWAKDVAGNVSASASASVVVTIPPPEPAGWFAGDMHAHRSCGGAPETLSSMHDRMSPQNLAVISLLADMGNGEVQDASTDLPLVNGQDSPVSTPGRIVHWDTEWHWDATYAQYPHQALGGHIVALGLTQAQPLWQEYTYPIFDWVHQHGGIAGFAHLERLDNNLPQNLDCCVPIEYPVEVALGSSDFISEDVTDVTSTLGMCPECAVQAYYRLLNTGFRPGYAAGTDYPCNSGGDLGTLLTYVQIPDGQLTYSKWIQGIAQGRTVVSRNGHNEFLNLQVNSTAAPGDEIHLTGAGNVAVSATWTATQDYTGTIELVQNGAVVATQQASAGPGSAATLNAQVNFTRSGWLAARRMGPLGHYLQTGAVYVIVNSAPVRASASDAQFYASWMDTLLANTSPGGVWNSYFPTSLSQAQARYQAARTVFQQIAVDATAPVITAVTSAPGSITATIAWTTDKSSTSRVDYGTTPSLGSTASDSTLLTAHSLNLTGLAPATTYYFRVTSLDAFNNGTSSPVAPATGSFSTIDNAPPVITSVVATPGAGGTATITWITNKPSSSQVGYGTTSSLGATSSNASLVTAHSVTLTGLVDGATYYYQVTSVDSLANISSSPQAVFVQSASLSLWDSSATPAVVDVGDGSAVELGMKFRSDAAGTVTGLRFYKASTNTGPHIGNLWTSTGTLLGTVTFTNETDSGWQQANFSSPVAIAPATTYVVSYFAPNGHYSYTSSGFAPAGADNPPLHALAGGVDGPNGVFQYGSASAFPSSSYNSTNYWVDLVYLNSVAPVISAVIATPGTGGTATITWTTNKPSNSRVDFGTTTSMGATATDASLVTVHSIALAGLTPGTTYYFQVASADAAGNASGSPQATFVQNAVASVWGFSAVPAIVDSGDGVPVELGMKFRSDVAGTVTGLRFYKASANTGTHIGNLWSSAGTLLGTVTFTNETASGWQQANFAAPVAISAATTYVVSYFAPNGHYSSTSSGFAPVGVDSPPLHALANGVDGANGVYQYGPASLFPSSSYNATNYWVDLVFAASLASQTSVSLSPSSLTFANQASGSTSAVQAVTLTNTGTIAVTIAGIAIAGTNSGDFAQTNTCAATLAAGANCTINLTFTPSASGARAATLTITDSAADSPQTAALAGTGTAPAATLAPTALAFGNQGVGSASAAQTITLANGGTGPLSLASIAITGINGGDFSQTNNCGASVAAGGNCTINVTFTPSASGARSGTLSVADNATGSPHTATLTGTGAVPSAALSPSSLAFGNQAVAASSASKAVTLTNTGSVPLTVTSITIAGTNGNNFSQTNNCGTSVAAGGNCTINVTFTPSASGTRSGTLTVADNATGSPQTAALTGTGVVPAAALSPSSLVFGNQAVGTSSAAKAVTLTNVGSVPLTVTSITVAGTNSNNFSQTNNCGTSVAAGGRCTINVTFTPSASGARSGTLTVADNASGSPQTAALTGTGALPAVTLSPTSLAFGNQAVGTASSAQAITLRNSGTAALTLTGITFTGANGGDFSQTNNCGSSLAVGANCTISVTFKPTASGARSASISIADNAANSPQAEALTGTGTAPAVSLSPASVAFATTKVGSTTAGTAVTLKNTGTATLNITSTTITGANPADFTRTTTCGSTLTAGSSCTITVAFAPQASGARAATLSVADNASGSPQTVSLSGTGTAVSLSAATISFASRIVGTASAASNVTMTNLGATALSISSIAISGTNGADFSQTNTCGTALAARASCTISVKFTPSARGARTGTLTIRDSDPVSPQTVALTGTGL